MRDLSDVTFIIPVRIDSEDRIRNLNIVTMYLREHFNTQIIVSEQDKAGIVPDVLGKTLYDTYILYKTDGLFHKTRLINAAAKIVKTPLIAMCDSDILINPGQYEEAASHLRGGSADFSYPFNGKCINIVAEQIPRVMETLVFDFVAPKVTNPSGEAHGGCVMYSKEKFMAGGMMNERLVAYGPEDGEQNFRFTRLNYKRTRTSQPLYHLNHARTINSSDNHAHSSKNWQEYNRIKNMKRKELVDYISTWPWLK